MAYSPSPSGLDDIFFQTINTSLGQPRVDLLARMQRLTLDDKELLKQCWHHLAKNKDDVAVEVFVLLIKQCPEAKKLFYFTDDDVPITSSKRMKSDCALQFHALRFIQIVETMIESIDEPRSLESLLLSLGQLHVRFRDKCGFQPFYWSIFCECVLFVFRERLKHRTDDVDRAMALWRLVMGAIKQKMKQGFYEGDRIRRELFLMNVSQSISMTFPANARRSMRPSIGVAAAWTSGSSLQAPPPALGVKAAKLGSSPRLCGANAKGPKETFL